MPPAISRSSAARTYVRPSAVYSDQHPIFIKDPNRPSTLADPDRGACRDGLGADGANRNEGAESTLVWLLSVERIRELRQGRS